MVDQFKIVGGDHTPTLCKNEGEGAEVKRSFLIIARVTSVMPESRFRINIAHLRRDIQM